MLFCSFWEWRACRERSPDGSRRAKSVKPIEKMNVFPKCPGGSWAPTSVGRFLSPHPWASTWPPLISRKVCKRNAFLLILEIKDVLEAATRWIPKSKKCKIYRENKVFRKCGETCPVPSWTGVNLGWLLLWWLRCEFVLENIDPNLSKFLNCDITDCLRVSGAAQYI